jgi:hypothetical protein
MLWTWIAFSIFDFSIARFAFPVDQLFISFARMTFFALDFANALTFRQLTFCIYRREVSVTLTNFVIFIPL